MYTFENYILDAIETVEAVSAWWDLSDDEAFINAVYDQARLMSGYFDFDGDIDIQ